MATDFVVDPFDPDTAPEALFEERYELSKVQHEEEEPEDPMWSYARWRETWRHVPTWQKRHHWSATDAGGGELLGVANISLNHVETNRNLAWFGIYVRPDQRRRGIATRLLAPILEVASADERTLLGAGAREASAGDDFLSSLGAELKSTERKSRLLIADLDLDMLRDWVARANERATGYRLVQWENRCPDEYLGRFVKLTEVMNTAPRDDLEMEDWVETPERYREGEERSLAQGNSWWTMVAEKAETGELAGYTEVSFSPEHDDIAWQGATAVDPVHRNLGLGRWLKASMALKLVDERPKIAKVDTWNAFSNGPMLNINIAMGFQLVRGYTDWQVPTDRLAKAVSARL